MSMILSENDKRKNSYDYYYQDELAYMREMGRVFSDAYPRLAPFLAKEGADPDVERLLEGFAFIASRIRLRLDNSLSEFLQDVHNLMWPQLLRPIPSFSVVAFTPPMESITKHKELKKGSEVCSVPVQGTSCVFRTCYDVTLFPLAINDIQFDNIGGRSSINIDFETAHTTTLSEMGLDVIRLYINADAGSAAKIYHAIFACLAELRVDLVDGEESVKCNLDKNDISMVGFTPDTSILPYPENTFEAHQHLLEYFSFQKKYLFFDIRIPSKLSRSYVFDKLQLKFKFTKKLDFTDRINETTFLLYCTPVVNLFSLDAEPVRHNERKMEHIVRPAGNMPDHYAVYSVDDVVAYDDGGRITRRLYQLDSARQNPGSEHSVNDIYQIRVRPSVTGGVENVISFRAGSTSVQKNVRSVVSIRLTCTNANLPEKLRQGDIKIAGDGIPANIKVTNVCVPSKTIMPPLDNEAQWRMLSNFSANYLAFTDERNIKQVLSSYHILAKSDRQAHRELQKKLDSMIKIDVEPVVKFVQGIPVQGQVIKFSVHGEKYTNEGDMYMFFTILASYFSLLTGINQLCVLEVDDVDRGEKYSWNCNIEPVSHPVYRD